MKSLQITLISAALLGLTACTTPGLVSRAAAPSTGLLTAEGGSIAPPAYQISAVNVTVPYTLKVSEANSYKPVADIVWREDPLGDRYTQVDAIVTDAILAGVSHMQGGREVILNIEITRFHALTERTRYSVGGVHDIHFIMDIVDAETGIMIEEGRHVETELKAFGGLAALSAEARGQTQKVRITAHLGQVIRHELAQQPVTPTL